MSTSDYALITSLFSIAIAIGALVWNVWQKFIFVKPALQVTFGIYRAFQSTSGYIATPTGHRLLRLTVTNLGPGAVVLYACIAKTKALWWRKPELSMINPIHGDPMDEQPISIGPFGFGLPTKIDVGDTKSFYFPYAEDCFLREGVHRVGINDTYQRNTWCRRHDMRKACRSYREDFEGKGGES
jgi:hypothetical protein